MTQPGRARCFWWLLGGAVLLTVLAGCTVPPRPLPPPLVPTPFVSPLTRSRPQRVYLPQVRAAYSKLGLATHYDWPAARTFTAARTLGARWLYDWSPTPPAGLEFEAVPMIWGATPTLPTLGGNSRWLLGPNEPDLAGQANLTPEAGARLWARIEAAYPERLLVAPAPSDQHPEWLPQMRAAYLALYQRSPRWDALAVHCYRQSAGACITLVEQFATWARQWGTTQVWVTEFAFLPAFCDAPVEAQAFVAYLERTPFVTRYAPYMAHEPGGNPNWPDTRPAANPSLTSADGRALTPLGRYYAQW